MVAVDEGIITAGIDKNSGLPQPLLSSMSFQSRGKGKVYAVALGATAVMSEITDVGAQGHM